LPLSIAGGIGPISISVGPILCQNATLHRDSLTSSSVQWSGNNITLMPRWDLAYMIKVAQGAKPKFTARLYFPNYVGYKDGGTYYGYPTWAFTRQWLTDPWIVTAP
jgi:hypothetical protein